MFSLRVVYVIKKDAQHLTGRDLIMLQWVGCMEENVNKNNGDTMKRLGTFQ
jgi:hypothetical protein